MLAGETAVMARGTSWTSRSPVLVAVTIAVSIKATRKVKVTVTRSPAFTRTVRRARSKPPNSAEIS